MRMRRLVHAGMQPWRGGTAMGGRWCKDRGRLLQDNTRVHYQLGSGIDMRISMQSVLHSVSIML